MLLFFAQIVHVIVKDYMKQREHTYTRKFLSTGKGPRAVAQGALSEGLLGQFSLAKEQSDGVEGKAKETRDEDENERNTPIMQCAQNTKLNYGRKISEKTCAKVFQYRRSVRWCQQQPHGGKRWSVWAFPGRGYFPKCTQSHWISYTGSEIVNVTITEVTIASKIPRTILNIKDQSPSSL